MSNQYGQQQPNQYGQQPNNQYGQQQPNNQYGQQQNMQQQNMQQQPNNQYGQQQNNNQYGQQQNMQQQNMQQQPVFKQIAVGKGIDQQEYQTIITCCSQVIMQRQLPFSTSAGKLIKSNLGNDWFVIVGNVNEKDYDFSVTSVEGGDFLSFTLDNSLFQVVKTSR